MGEESESMLGILDIGIKKKARIETIAVLKPNKNPVMMPINFKRKRRNNTEFRKLPTMPAGKIKQLKSLTTLELFGAPKNDNHDLKLPNPLGANQGSFGNKGSVS